jgi:hypothetical protein
MSVTCCCCGGQSLLFDCDYCEQIRSFLHDSHMSERDIPVHDNLLLKVNYQVEEEDHDGYCSDPYEETTISIIYDTTVFPLLKIIEIDSATRISPSNLLIQRFYRRESKPHEACRCRGCETRYEITSAEIISGQFTKKPNGYEMRYQITSTQIIS